MSCDWNAGLGILLLGLAAHIVGFASPFWVVIGGVDFGLWQICGGGRCVSFMTKEASLSGWFHAVQALALGGMVAAILAFFTSVLYIRTQNRSLTLAPGLLAFIAGNLVGTGVLVYAAKEWTFSDSLGWAFYLECGSVGALLISSLVFLVAAGRTRRKSREVNLSTRCRSLPQNDDIPRLTTEL